MSRFAAKYFGIGRPKAPGPRFFAKNGVTRQFFVKNTNRAKAFGRKFVPKKVRPIARRAEAAETVMLGRDVGTAFSSEAQ